MKRIIKETLNEKVFAELSVKVDKQNKVTYNVTAYFKWSEKFKEVTYNKLKDAKKAYKFIIKQ